MSQRGSWVTEYVYCPKCVAALDAYFKASPQGKYLSAYRIPSWDNSQAEPMPIWAGKVGGLYLGEEAHAFEFEVVPELEKVVGCKLRIAVLPESLEGEYDKTFIVVPAAPHL